MMFEGFEIGNGPGADGVSLRYRIGGVGPPVLLLHGYPQTHAMWHKVAPLLSNDCTVVVADLRGYGDSSKPAGGTDHAAYSKRAMAADMVELMHWLGFDAFAVVGHDRGGRVAHRMALDHQQKIRRLAVLDIVPTHTLFERTNKAFAIGYYHWFFLAQPAPLPERMIGADPKYFLATKMGHWSATGAVFDPEAMAEYERCFANPETIRASCEDYRAAASIDLEHDAADFARKVVCPTLALWGEHGLMHRLYDVLQTWREKAENADGRSIPSGHFLAEEAPEETLLELRRFLRHDNGDG